MFFEMATYYKTIEKISLVSGKSLHTVLQAKFAQIAWVKCLTQVSWADLNL